MAILWGSRPTEHHQVRVEHLFGVASAKGQTVREISLGCEAITAKRVRDLVINEDKGRLFLRTIHLEAMIRL